MPRLKRTASPVTTDTAEPVTKRNKTIADTAASSRSRRGTGNDTVELIGLTKSSTVKGTTHVAAKSQTGGTKPVKGSTKKAPAKPTTKEKTSSPEPPKRKRGRPSKAEIEARNQAKETQATSQTAQKAGRTKVSHGTVNVKNVSEASREADDTALDVSEEEASSDEGHSYWLMKAEPESRLEKGVDVKFSIQDLEAAKEPEPWDGVRSYAARNNMRSMIKGDLAFFYHSSCKIPSVVGIMEIVQEHTPDKSALDPKHPYYDPKEKADAPKWCVVHVEHRLTFDEPVRLKDLQQHKGTGQALAGMQLLTQSRLSVSKVSRKEWNFILSEAGIEGKEWKAGVDE